MRLQRFHGLCLPCSGILDRLRLVEDDQRPLACPERFQPRQRAVRGDDEIGAGKIGAPQLAQLARTHGRGMSEKAH